MKRTITLVSALMALIPVFAQSFESDGLYFEILTSDTAECSLEASQAEPYSGTINIPATVNFEGTVYTVAAIGPYAFAGCDELVSVEIPPTVEEIGRNAFQSCIALSSISLPSSVEEVADQTFYGCVTLKSFDGPEVTALGKAAFSGCVMLSETGLSAAPLYVSDSAFKDCRSLQSFMLPEGSVLGEGVFSGCTALVTVMLPTDMTKVPEGTFNGCSSLSEVGNSERLTEIGDYAFYTCRNLETFVFGPELHSIGKNAFGFCSSLEFETIPGYELRVGDYAFTGCASLSKISLPGTVELGVEAFANATGLTEIYFGTSMRNIADRAFRNCKSITQVECMADQPPFLALSAFEKTVLESASLIVPYIRRNLYAMSPPWSDFMHIIGGDDSLVHTPENLSNTCRLSIDGLVLKIDGPAAYVGIFTIDGVTLFNGEKPEGTSTFELPSRQIYLVTINGVTHKLAI